ncbi:MAG: hypothetical protein OXC92_07125 [Flavobacteriaceae bacterium]|nr:hypothetical protein [Flavobacteriaceae bacterium]MCY4216734.1 hypothetical protein [Flavobacteriaceae bacterium]MCY4266817.1 hypothetical protein [Flavobacteriaceae bacterium]
MKYKVVYIDEVDSEIRSFKRSVKLRANEKFDISVVKPKPTIESTVSEIINQFADAVVADFRLSEEAPEVHYNGSTIIEEILKIRKDFPVFILTSFEDDAIDKGFDVNIVYQKKDILSNSKFFDRVVNQIKKHRVKIKNAETRTLELIKKREQKQLSQQEEYELLELDQFIEERLDQRGLITKDLKTITNSKRLKSLLDKADKILEEIKKK